MYIVNKFTHILYVLKGFDVLYTHIFFKKFSKRFCFPCSLLERIHGNISSLDKAFKVGLQTFQVVITIYKHDEYALKKHSYIETRNNFP